MRLWQVIVKNLLRRPTRTFLTIVGLSVAVSAVVALVGVSYGFERSFLDLYRGRRVDLVVQPAEEGADKVVDESLWSEFEAIPGVARVIGGLVDAVSIFEREKGIRIDVVLLNGWRADCPTYDEFKLVSGRRLTDADGTGIVLGRILAENLGKKVGDSVEVYNDDFTVVGIMEGPSVYDNGAGYLLLTTAQRLRDCPGRVTGYTIALDRPDDPRAVADAQARIEELGQGKNIRAKSTSEFVSGVTQIRVVRAVCWATSAIAVLIGAIGMLNTMVMSVYERAKEIGTLRAMGWRRSRVIRMILGESLLLSLGGAILGTISAVIITHFFSRLPTVSGLVQGDIAPEVMLQGFAIALIVGLLGAAYPAVWGANLQPVEALRKK